MTERLAIAPELARQALLDGGFDELPPALRSGGLELTFRHRELPLPWSIVASMGAGDSAVAHVDVFLRFGEHQVGNVHRVTSHLALVSKLPAIVSGLTALVGSQALMCPRCGTGWVTVRQPEPGGPPTVFLGCTESCEPGPVLTHVQAIVTY